MTGYRMSKTDFFFGGPAFLVNMRSSIDSTFSLRGQGTIDRRSIIPDDDEISGLTADGLEAGVSASGAFRKTPQTDLLLANPEGILFIHRRDALFAYALPMNLDSDALQIPALAALTISLSWSPGDESDPVAGIPVVGGALTVVAGNTGYILDKNTETITTVGMGLYAITATQVGVHGPPLDAE